MKREKIIILLERIKKHKLEPQSIKLILKQDEQILDKLVNLKEELFIKGINLINVYTGDTILEALDILSNSKYSYTYEVLINDNLIKRELSLTFGRIINSLGAVYSSEYLKCILCNRTDIPTDMLFICTEIIKNTKHYFNAKYVSEVLCSGIILNDEILLLLKEIATIDKIYCARYISDILIYSTLDLDTISLGIYEIINKRLDIRETVEGGFASKRDLDLLDSFSKQLSEAVFNIEEGMTIDVIETMLLNSTHKLDELLGNNQTMEDLYSTVFAKFCVGK